MIKYIGLVLILFVMSCVKPATHKTHSDVKVTHKTPVVMAKNNEVTPERTAAQHLVEMGKDAVDQNHYDQATDSFQEAMAVDPSYGVSFLELAKLKYHLGNIDESKSLLEKASSLLSHEPDWESLWQPEIENFKATFLTPAR